MIRGRFITWSVVLLVLIAANAAIAYALFYSRPEVLTVSFLDVGQGDAIFVRSPDGVEMLIDGGKDRSALRELPRLMGPLDRNIDLIVETHPDADHIGGLPGILERYGISYFLSPGKESDTSINDALRASEASEPGLEILTAREGMRIHLGEEVYADILHPDDNVTQLRDTNDASVVMRLVYGESEFMLSGDAPSWVEDRLVAEYGEKLRSDVLKAGHHGSKTSTDAKWLSAIAPDVVVISAGKDNSYGHPHPDVLARIQNAGAAILSTIDSGTITFVSDGTTVTKK